MCIINIPSPEDISDLQRDMANLVESEIQRIYGKEDGEIGDSEIDELMQPIYDEHDGT